MVRKITRVALCCALIILLSACTGVDVIGELGDNSSFPFRLTLPESELSYGDEYRKGMGFGCYSIETDGLFITVSGWPDVTDVYHVTEYRVTGGLYPVFGISVGNEFASADSALKRHGYKMQKLEKGRRAEYIKGTKVIITLFLDTEGLITEYWVSACVTNKGNVVF